MPDARRQIYLDHNAGAPLRPVALEAMRTALVRGGNASSIHRSGRAARALVEEARRSVATIAGVDAAQVIFTSGATEANVMALSPVWFLNGRPVTVSRLLVGATEHPSVLAGGRFQPDAVEVLPVDGDGRIDPAVVRARVEALTAAGERSLVSVMAANNETGVLQPLAEIGAALKGTEALFHIDAVQAAGRMPIDIGAWRADALSLSAHKIGGPQGAGALALGSAELAPAPLLVGGAQEGRRRAGTENVPAIAGFGAAAVAVTAELDQNTQVYRLRAFLEDGLRHICPETVVFGAASERLANTTCFAVPGISAETALIALDLEGIAVSSGSACSSGKVGTSHVLAAMGVAPDLARGALRISMGQDTTEEEIAGLLKAWRDIAGRMRSAKAERAA